MAESIYFADTAEGEAEQHRLRELERQLDPHTRATLIGLGLAPGQSVLEIGPGAGGMLAWIADTVGAAGHVTGLDISPRFLDHIDQGNIAVVEGDLMLVDPSDLPGAPFDIVYARYVAMHLSDPAAALERMKNLMKPGCRILLVDPDFESMRSIDPDHPKSEVMDQYLDWFDTALRDLDIMELKFGRRLPFLMEAAGFEDVETTGMVKVVRGGTLDAAFWEASARTSAPFVQQAGYIENFETDMDFEIWRDPTFGFMSPIDFFTTGRAPAK